MILAAVEVVPVAFEVVLAAVEEDLAVLLILLLLMLVLLMLLMLLLIFGLMIVWLLLRLLELSMDTCFLKGRPFLDGLLSSNMFSCCNKVFNYVQYIDRVQLKPYNISSKLFSFYKFPPGKLG